MLITKTSACIFRLFWFILVTVAFLCQTQAHALKPLLQAKALDPAGAPIAGARITAVPEGRGGESSTVSDQSGVYSLALDPGSYTIKISAQGFMEVLRTLSIKDND